MNNLTDNINEILEVNTEVLYNAVVFRNKQQIPYTNINWETLKKIILYHEVEMGRKVIYKEVC